MPPELKRLSALFMKVDCHKYLVASKCLFENILLEDTIIQPNYYLITRYSYWVREVCYFKILLFFSVSNYYLQDKKIRYCPSLVLNCSAFMFTGKIIKPSSMCRR